MFKKYSLKTTKKPSSQLPSKNCIAWLGASKKQRGQFFDAVLISFALCLFKIILTLQIFWIEYFRENNFLNIFVYFNSIM